MNASRRDFLKAGAALAASTTFSNATFAAGSSVARLADSSAPNSPPRSLFGPDEYRRIDSTERVFHISASVYMHRDDEGLPELWRENGVTDVWLNVWNYGDWAEPLETLDYWFEQYKKAGLRPHMLTMPFGHGGGAPERWKKAKRWDGSETIGWSWHSPSDAEGAQAIRELRARYGRFDYFLDDDFRFSSNPSAIGGCVCDECRAGFLKASGLDANRWDETLDDVRNNADTPLLRAWVDYFCDRLTQCCQTYQAAAPDVDLGVMVMYMGCERAGIRLDAYRDFDSLFRVGEGMFDDAWFAPPKSKSIELFSALLHRRFCRPGRAFSETTVYPELALTPENLASKLSVSTIADVRNTCFMCSIPPRYWTVLGPRVQKEKTFHNKLLGAKPVGPFKHFYGTAARYLAGENAYSLFLALGVPFEVCDRIPADGWTFLADADAAAVERGDEPANGSKLFARFASQAGKFEKLDETLDALFAWRRSILPELRAAGVPYVEEEVPVVLSWYPDARCVYLWNLGREPVDLRLRRGDKTAALTLAGRDSALIDDERFV